MTEANGYFQAPPLTAARPTASAWRHVSPDAVFSFGVFAPLAFAGPLGTLSAVTLTAAVVFYAVYRLRALPELLFTRALLLLFPLYAVFSTLWSQAPMASAKYGIEFCITVAAGMLLAAAKSQAGVLKGATAAFLLYGLVSLAFGGTVGMGNAGQHAFSGLTESKNLLADTASTGAIIALILLAIAMHRRSWLWAGIAAIAIVLDVYLVFAARSAGALTGLALGVFALSALMLLRVSGQAIRGVLTAILALIVVFVALSYRWLTTLAIEAGATMFGKDPTLTGRTYLWYRAQDLVQEAPLLGRGYSAFWIQGNTDAEGLWRYAGIAERTGFTFHNIGVEILVHLGWIGLVLFALTLVIGLLAMTWKFVVRPDLALCFWFSIVFYEVLRMPIESVGMAPFNFSTVLLYGGLAAAFAPRPAQAPSIVKVETLPPTWATPPSELIDARS